MSVDVEARRRYRKRLLMPLRPTTLPSTTPFETKSGIRIANGYEKVVIGDRGAYIEFAPEHMVDKNLVTPDDQRWRTDPQWIHKVYYLWYTDVNHRIKVYYQMQKVDYAEYQVGMYYIDPMELQVPGFGDLYNPAS